MGPSRNALCPRAFRVFGGKRGSSGYIGAMTKLIAAAVLALSIAIGVGASAASAGDAARLGTPFEVLLAKSADGNYKRSGSLNLDPKEKRTVFWSVESLASVDLDITFDDALTGDGAPADIASPGSRARSRRRTFPRCPDERLRVHHPSGEDHVLQRRGKGACQPPAGILPGRSWRRPGQRVRERVFRPQRPLPLNGCRGG